MTEERFAEGRTRTVSRLTNRSGPPWVTRSSGALANGQAGSRHGVALKAQAPIGPFDAFSDGAGLTESAVVQSAANPELSHFRDRWDDNHLLDVAKVPTFVAGALENRKSAIFVPTNQSRSKFLGVRSNWKAVRGRDAP
jgi:hypothetical protein